MENQEPNKGGRPTNQSRKGRKPAITEAVLRKLEAAFAVGCTDDEACLYADIAPATLYKYQNDNLDFLEWKRLIKQRPVLKARNVIIGALDAKDIQTAKWYLERKRSSEFGEKQKVEHSGIVATTTLDDENPEDVALRNEFKERLRANIYKRADEEDKELITTEHSEVELPHEANTQEGK